MSITDELREWWVRKFPIMDKELNKDFIAIADRIDAEHQKALDEWKAKHGQMWLKGYSECHAELLEGNETLASDLERCGWIRLPKDADGEYINIGDVMESKGSNLLFGESSFEVRSMRCDECGWEVYDRLGGRYVPSLLRHHHAPTVEDVLTEFAAKLIERGELTNGGAQTIAEYAAKLRLREDAC